MRFPLGHHFFWHNNLSGDQTPNCFCEKWNKLWYLEELSDTVGFSLELGACYPFRGDWLREILATNSLLALSTATRWWTCLTNLVWNDKYMLWEWSENTFFFKQSRGEDNCLQEVFSNGSTFCELQPPGGGLGLHISWLCRQKLQERKKINCWPSADIIADFRGPGERLKNINNWALYISFLPFRSMTVWKASLKLVTASATFSTFDVVTLFHLHSSPGDQLPSTTFLFTSLTCQ